MLLPLLLSAGDTLKIYVLHWNDGHGHLGYNEAFWLDRDFPPTLANARALAYLVRQYRERAKEEGALVLVMDAADYFQGDPLGELTRGKLYMQVMNYIGVDVGAVGNHDFDFGRDILDSLAKWANFPLVSANLVDTAGNLPSFARPYVVIDTMGVRILVFGLITHWLKGMVPPQNMPDLDVKWEYSFVKDFVPKVREKEKPDIVIGLTHVGFRHDKRDADSVRGIDLIVGGHSHTGVVPPYFSRLNSTAIVQAYAHLANLGVVEILYDKRNRVILNITGKIITLTDERVPSDPYIDSLLTVWEAKVDSIYGVKVAEALGDFTRGGFTESSMGNLVTDAMRWYVENVLKERDHPVVAIYNAAGIRDNFKTGPITRRDIYKAFPFPNTLMYGKVKGRDLLKILGVGYNGHHAIFVVSGLKVEYDNSSLVKETVRVVLRDTVTYDSIGVKEYVIPVAKVRILEVDGKPFNPDSTYTIATNDYLMKGGGEYVVFRTVRDVKDTGRRISYILEDYLKSVKKVKPRTEGRIKKVKLRL